MVKKFLAAIPLAALLAGGTTLPAHADTPNCAAKQEFKKATKGMKIGRVHEIFDIAGKQVSFYGATSYSNAMQMREYQPCDSEYGFVWIDFERKGGVWKLTGKNAYWG